MSSLFRIYAIIFPYILFLNILSFGTNNLGIGTLIFAIILFTFFLGTIFFIDKLNINKYIFIGLASFLIIQLVKIFTYNVGEVGINLFVGYLGNWLFFLLNFIISSIFLKNSNKKEFLIKMLSYSLLTTTIIGILHYYIFYNISFMDSSYGTDENGTIFNVANYDIMRFRESSIYFGPNVNAYMSVIGYISMIFTLLSKGLSKMFRSPKYWLFTILHTWNILISDSRSGFILIIILTILLINEKSLNTFKTTFKQKFFIFFIFMTIFIIYIYSQPRFNYESIFFDSRFIKILTGLEILSNNISIFIIGTPVNFKWVIGDVSVSDNLYIALFLYVGLLGVLILSFTVRLIFKKINLIIYKNDDFIYNLFTKYLLIMFLLAGIFSIPIAMMPPMIYLGIFLGGIKLNN
jgi:hypothetical protein